MFRMPLAILLAAVLLTGCEPPPASVPKRPVSKAPSPGQVAPDIVGVDIDGVAFKLSDYRGKVVMLDFWGLW